MPLFSMNTILNQDRISICSCKVMWVFTQILMTWSMISMVSTSNAASHPLFAMSCLTIYYFLPAIFDSTLSVAWGTAFRRSLGISLPVMRSIP